MSSLENAAPTKSLARAFGLSQDQSRAVFNAAREIVEADEQTPRAARLLEVLRRALDLEVLPARSPASEVDLAAAFPQAASRQPLADALVIAACADEEVTRARELAAMRLADALEVSSGWVRLVGSLRRRSTFAIKRQLMRRSPDARRLLSRTWEEEGVLGALRAVQFMAGWYRDDALAARFHALESLGTGTFGRTFYDHIQTRGLSFPGEKGGMPERMVHHDLMHVLNDYGTDASGECELAGFYAGFSRPDGFTFIMIALTTFQLGLAVSPAIVTPAHGAFDPQRVLAAFLRGRQLNVDVMGPWDYWALLPLPLSEAREQLGLASPSRAQGFA